MFIGSFEARRYRGIDGLSLKRLSRANLITGSNGIGKTALIEAIWLFTGRHNTPLLWNPNVQRSFNPVVDPVAELSDGFIEIQAKENQKNHEWKVEFEPVDSVGEVLVNAGDTQETIQIPVVGELHTWIDGKKIGSDSKGAVHQTKLGAVLYKTPPRPLEKTTSIIEGTSWLLAKPEEYLQRYSSIVRSGLKDRLIEAVNLILPGIKDLELLTDKTGTVQLSARVLDTSRTRQLPLHSLGGGVVRMLRLYLSLFTARNGLVLIDEIENGMHFSVLRNLWDLVRKWSREWDVQLVATTHSNECIEAAMAAFETEPDGLSIHRLYGDDSGSVKAVTFTGETLEGARDLDLEVR